MSTEILEKYNSEEEMKIAEEFNKRNKEKPFDKSLKQESEKKQETKLTPEEIKNFKTLELKVENNFQPVIDQINYDLNLKLEPREEGFHLTMITPSESDVLKKLSGQKIDELYQISNELQNNTGFEIAGIGFIDGSKQENLVDTDKRKKVCYIAINSPRLQEFRKSIGLPEKDLHITLGREKGDIHEIISGKDEKGNETYKPISKKANPEFDKYKNLFSNIEFGKLHEEKTKISKKGLEIIDIGGREKDLPVIKEIIAAIKSGENFQIVGGGGSGKTENLLTAIDIEGKDYEMFDLRKWIIENLSNTDIRHQMLINPESKGLGKDYLLKLEKRIDELEKGLTEKERGKQIESIIKKDYLNDETLGIKYAEGILLNNQMRNYELMGKFNDRENNLDLDGKNSLENILRSDSEIIILDEFDMGIGVDLSDVEIENAKKLIQIVKKLPNKQIISIIHPPARGNENFMQTINKETNHSGEVKEIEMEFIPEDIQKEILTNIGIEGEAAKKFIDEMSGLPTAYLEIITNPEFREKLLEKNPEERIFELRKQVEEKVTKNKKIIFDREPKEVQNFLLKLANNKTIEEVSDNIKARAKRTMYVFESDGKFFMPPIVKEIIKNK